MKSLLSQEDCKCDLLVSKLRVLGYNEVPVIPPDWVSKDDVWDGVGSLGPVEVLKLCVESLMGLKMIQIN